MTTAPPDFPDHMLHMAINEIMTAPTENKAAYAAAKVYNPLLDMSDKVQQALEDRVLQLRHPVGAPYPPYKPSNFDVMHLVTGAYYRTLDINAPQQKGHGAFYGPPGNYWAAASQPARPPARQPAPPPQAGPPAGGPAMGPPTHIRRGFRPRGPPGNARPQFMNYQNTRPATGQQQTQGGFGQPSNFVSNWNNAGPGIGSSLPNTNTAAQTVSQYPQPASDTSGWMNPFYNSQGNPSWWTK